MRKSQDQGLLEPTELGAAGSRLGSGEEPASVASFLWGQCEGGLGSAEENRGSGKEKGRLSRRQEVPIKV